MSKKNLLVSGIVASLTGIVVLSLGLTRAAAQQTGGGGGPSAAPTPVQEFPLGEPPPGYDPAFWANYRQQCTAVAAKFAAWFQMSEADREKNPWTVGDRGLLEECQHEVGAAAAQKYSNEHAATPSGTPVPLLQLTPPPPPAPSSSSVGSPSGSSSGSQSGVQFQFAGGGGSACASTSQPPDVAADVSPAENVEFLNQGWG